MIITGDDVDGIAALKSDLARRFEMKDLGHLSYFLEIKVSSPRGYLFTQSKYETDVIDRARLTDTKTADTPLETNVCYSSSDGIPLPILLCTALLLEVSSVSPSPVSILLMLFTLLVSLSLLQLPFTGELLFVFCAIFVVLAFKVSYLY
ncbi:Gag-pol polyprotein [Abeliophyllum distichum]|uniref:Gag-pol polyprotein n=1 Tax=Abeliophyllum distichum TaxID=126358 RepID=A0ABD1VUU7_9LAMI